MSWVLRTSVLKAPGQLAPASIGPPVKALFADPSWVGRWSVDFSHGVVHI